MGEISVFNSGYTGENTGDIPLGALWIAAVLEEAGHEVVFSDYQTECSDHKPDPTQFARFLKKHDKRVLGVNAICGNLPTVLEGISLLKQDEPDRFIILGGPSAADAAHDIMVHYPVDVVVRGEGEKTIVEVMDRLDDDKDLSGVAGVTYRNADEIVSNPDRKRIHDLDELPHPALHHIDTELYLPVLPVMTSRGCPYRCQFCAAHAIWQRRLTSFSPQWVANYVAAAARHKMKAIEFLDDTFLVDVNRCHEIIDAIRGAGVDLAWGCAGRIDRMDKQMLESLRAKGLQRIFYGVESGSDGVLARIDKTFTYEQARQVISWTDRCGIRQRLSFIWGFPFETMDDFYDTLMGVAECQSIEKSQVQLYLLNPLRSAPLTDEFRSLLRFSITRAEHMNVSMLPSTEYRLKDYPLLVDAIKRHPDLYSSFYYFDHVEMEEKSALIQRLDQSWQQPQG